VQIIYLINIYLLFAMSRLLYQSFLGFIYLAKVPSGRRKLRDEPLVSVLIPAWNEEVGIIKTVQSVLDSTYKNVEVVVIDDGSTDRTVELVASKYKTNNRVVLINDGHRGKAGALNRGLQDAHGEFILTLDADSYLTRKSIEQMMKVLATDTQYDVAIGEIVIGNARGGALTMAQYYEYLVGFHYKRTQQIFQSSFIFPGALTMFRRRLLDEVGEFDGSTVTEDLNYSMRVKQLGRRVAYIDLAVCITEGADSLRGLFNQRVRWRHGMLECLRRQPKFIFSRTKGWYLSLIELPLALLGLIEILLFPLVLVIAAWLIIMSIESETMSILVLSFWLLFLPILLLILRGISSHGVHRHKMPPQIALLLSPLLFAIINGIEFVALVKSLWLLARGRKNSWQRWQRKGADGGSEKVAASGEA
jgi:cellulose synthase/poly-beta-1,6-N-acetylglucosamine synthase-like glycosyltransferase